MTTLPTIYYNSCPIRVLTHEGSLWFPGLDVAIAAGYTHPKRAVKYNCTRSMYKTFSTQGGGQKLLAIPVEDVLKLANQRINQDPGFREWFVQKALPSLKELAEADLGGDTTALRTKVSKQISHLMKTCLRPQNEDNFILYVKDGTVSFHTNLTTLAEVYRGTDKNT